MGPYDAARDSNVGSGYAFGDESDVADSVADQLADELAPLDNNLGEQDYRDADNRPS